MPRRTLFFLCICCGVLSIAASCAEVPRPTNFQYSSQRQFQSVNHWQQVAKERISSLESDGVFRLTERRSDGSRPPIFIQNSGGSPFDEAFRRYLITELVAKGHALTDKSDDAAIQILWDLQLVNRNMPRVKPIGIPEAAAAELVAAVTGFRWTTSDILAPFTEVVLTTRVTVGEDSLARTIKSYSDTFYINDGDWNNYNYQRTASSVHPRSIAAHDEAWKRKLQRQGLLAQ